MIQKLKMFCAFGVFYCLVASLVYMYREDLGTSIWFLLCAGLNLYGMANVRNIVTPEDD